MALTPETGVWVKVFRRRPAGSAVRRRWPGKFESIEKSGGTGAPDTQPFGQLSGPDWLFAGREVIERGYVIDADGLSSSQFLLPSRFARANQRNAIEAGL